jgi:hypothetical protein
MDPRASLPSWPNNDGVSRPAGLCNGSRHPDYRSFLCVALRSTFLTSYARFIRALPAGPARNRASPAFAMIKHDSLKTVLRHPYDECRCDMLAVPGLSFFPFAPVSTSESTSRSEESPRSLGRVIPCLATWLPFFQVFFSFLQPFSFSGLPNPRGLGLIHLKTAANPRSVPESAHGQKNSAQAVRHRQRMLDSQVEDG